MNETVHAFASELDQVVEPVRQAFRRLLAAWNSPASAAELERATGAGTTVCWQVFRVATAPDVVAEARNVPTPSSLRRLLSASIDAGIAAETVQAVDAAARTFLAFSKRAASDRTAFNSMLSGVTPEVLIETVPVALRRTAYRAISAINGMQTDMIYMGSMVRAGSSPGRCNGVTLLSNVGIRRLRHDAQLTIYAFSSNPNQVAGEAQGESALDLAAAEQFNMPVLPQFSSNPLPQVERVEQLPGFISYNVVGNEVGAWGAFDCTFARHTPDIPLMEDTDGRQLFHTSYSYRRRPAALGIIELLVHRPSYPAIKVQAMAYQYREGDNSQAGARAAQQYPLEAKVVKVGRADVAKCKDMPRYSELIGFTAERVGWNLSEFDVYRYRVAFPIVFSTVRVFFYVS